MSSVTTAARPRRATRRGAQAAAVHLAAIVVSFVCAGPVVLLIVASLHDSVFADFSFANLTVANYERLLSNAVFLRWIVNSVLVASAVTALTVAVDMLAAYAFAKMRFAGRDLTFRLLLATMMLPFSATLVPVYLLASELGMIDRYSGLIVPALAGPFGVYLLRQFVRGIPDSLLEAARIDGAGHGGMFLRIVLPLCRQPMAVLAIFTFVANWNTFLWPLLIAQSEHMMTLPVGIATTNTQFAQNISMLTAGAVISIVPMAVLFVAFQRHFIGGVLAGAVKS
ncbi:carbohydrate ABC transporter permease [Jiangella mangrovi]|uniref:ABC-type glycerol-3-phosphate transport system permease component n=1 Tax=Jiangella mangrovi TaxID=1524084 RepID=A0A7W9GT41_9ACTN|nr:carbohydrate ABC transporter permease [Jiangella mangrovi]MBB5789543.1 ABC-type glycerol-3-phosphate transport system permease component [Jiangella mangrovi]